MACCAVSVGFRPLEFEFSGDPKKPHGLNFKSQELLEISLASIPALPEALIDTGKSYSTDRERSRRRRDREIELYRLMGKPPGRHFALFPPIIAKPPQ